MRTLLLVLCLSLYSLSFSQQSMEFFPGGTYDPSIPTPGSILGYEVGMRFTDYRNLERYLEKLSSSSHRLQRVVFGETYEQHPP